MNEKFNRGIGGIRIVKKKSLFSFLIVFTMVMQLLVCDKTTFTSYASGKQKIAISQTSVVIPKGVSTKLKITGTSKRVKWSSSNKKIASVSKSGQVKAKKTGKCYIKAKIGKKQVKCKVQVVGKYSEKQALGILKSYLKRQAKKNGYSFNANGYIWNCYKYKKNGYRLSYGLDSPEKVTWLGYYSMNARTGKGMDEITYEKINYLK